MDKTILAETTQQQKKTIQLTPYLCIQSPNKLARRYRLSSGYIVLGRGQSCDIVLDDERVSREHCRVWLDADKRINILDLNSTNGTKIDGKLIHQDTLSPHNRLKLGHHLIKVEYKDAEEIRQDDLLQTAATSDPLTGISNRKWFEERASHLIQTIRNKDQHLAVVMVDIDHFKRVNDTYGHQTGDRIIQGVAEILNTGKRQQDLLARYGGEEFILCLPDSNPQNTHDFCERVRQEIAKKIFCFEANQLSVTSSLGGYSAIVEQKTNLATMTAFADKALYHSKNTGRNRVSIV